MTNSELQEQIESILSRYRRWHERPSAEGMDDLYTGICGTVLGLEAERLRITRSITVALADSDRDLACARQAAGLARRGEELLEVLETLKRLQGALAPASARGQ